jgi:hypothetical protein
VEQAAAAAEAARAAPGDEAARPVIRLRHPQQRPVRMHQPPDNGAVEAPDVKEVRRRRPASARSNRPARIACF